MPACYSHYNRMKILNVNSFLFKWLKNSSSLYVYSVSLEKLFSSVSRKGSILTRFLKRIMEVLKHSVDIAAFLGSIEFTNVDYLTTNTSQKLNALFKFCLSITLHSHNSEISETSNW